MKTKTIFRKFPDGQIVALFPEIRYDRYVGSYMHIGQHGDADYDYVVRRTRPAAVEEHMPLLRELETIGYEIMPMKRRSRSRSRSSLDALS